MSNVERIASHVIETSIKPALSSYSKRRCVFVCGPMGSGKTTFIKDTLLPNEKLKAYYSSIDELTKYFPDSDSKSSYQLTREVGIITTDFLLDNKVSMIIEGTGVNSDMIEYLERLKKEDYHISTYFLKTDLKMCLDRVSKRNKRQERQVLPDDIHDYWNKLWGDKGMQDAIAYVSDRVCYVENYEDVQKISCSGTILETN